MTKLAREIDLLEKQIKLIEQNYSVLNWIVSEAMVTDNPLSILFEKYKRQLREKNLIRIRESKQIDIEESIKEIKNENSNTNIKFI